MSKLLRTTAKVFGINASPADDATSQGPEIGQFGSALIGTYQGTADIATIQSLPAWSQGFIGAVTPTNQYPPLPEMTGFGKVLSYQSAYLYQQGIPEWDAGTVYYANSFCSKNGNIYISNTNANENNDPTDDRVNWRIFENGGRSHNIFDIVIKDHILTYDDTFGFTMQGDYAYKEATAGVRYGYPDFYNKCLAEQEAGTATRITVGGYQFDASVNSNGHIYYNISDKAVIDNIYSAYGVAWYFGVDTTNERIVMPRDNYFFRTPLDTSTFAPGSFNYPGAPAITHTHTRGSMNITGSVVSTDGNEALFFADSFNNSGALSLGNFSHSHGAVTAGSGGCYNSINLNAASGWTGSTSNNSSVSSIYGRESNQIMPTSVNMVLYIVTGNTVDESAITINAALQNAIDALEAQETLSIGNIDDAKDDAIDDIDDAKDAAIEDIQEETADVIEQATTQADRAEDEADRAEAAAATAVAGQLQADWTQDDPDKVDYIKNKPVGIVLENETQTLTNKTINAADNTITGLDVSNFASGVISNEVRESQTASTQVIPSEMGVALALLPIQEQIEQIQLAKNPNLSIIGDITLNSGNASSFSATDYLQFPYVWDFGNYSWTIQMQFTTTNDVTTQQNILNSYYGVAVAIASGKFVLAISSNGSSWDIANSVSGTHTVEEEVTYTLKLSWDGSDYKLAYANDEVTFTDDITISSSTVHNATQEFVGASPNLFGTGTAYPFTGTINLNKWNLTVNDLMVWFGMDDAGLASRANVSLNNLDSIGEARFTNLQNAIGSVETTQNITTLSDGTITLANNSSIYKITPAGATTFTFSTVGLNLTSAISYTFELCVNMTTAYALTFPNSVTWQDGTAPDLSNTGLYFLVFRTIDAGTTWIGNLQGVW